MTTEQATAQVFWTAFRALKKTAREAVLERMLGDSEFREDLIDLAILRQRSKEPSRSLDAYLAERDRKRR